MGEPVEIITFGCRLNALESEVMRTLAAEAGLADAVLVNTCNVTEEAVRQARQAVRKARRERPSARIVVTGCAAQADPDVFAAMPEVDAVLGNREKLTASAFADFGVAAAPRVRVNAPSSKCRTAATTAAPSAPVPTAGGIPVRCRWAPWSSRSRDLPAMAMPKSS
jgi:threonylcarbamoyladenosine tRNA methylthiotransferase MtaB